MVRQMAVAAEATGPSLLREDDVDKALPETIYVSGFSVRQQYDDDIIIREADKIRSEALRATPMGDFPAAIGFPYLDPVAIPEVLVHLNVGHFHQRDQVGRNRVASKQGSVPGP